MPREDGNPKNGGFYDGKMVQYGNNAHANQATTDVQWIFVFRKIIVNQKQAKQDHTNRYN